jgi:5-methylcytosine-specific restriction endonuclease McrA
VVRIEEGLKVSREKRLRNAAPKWVTDCVDHWSSKVYEGDLGVDWSEATIRCWRCGHVRGLEQCHIIPAQFGGADTTDNIVPLCKRCHSEAPDVNDPRAMWDWIRETRATFYDCFAAQVAIRRCEARGITHVDTDKLAANLALCGAHFFGREGTSMVKPETYEWALTKSQST